MGLLLDDVDVGLVALSVDRGTLAVKRQTNHMEQIQHQVYVVMMSKVGS